MLGIASVIGMRFRTDMVAGLLDRPLEPGVLKELLVSALIRPAEGNRWRFAHALIRDAAYSGLLASRRRELHGRYAEQLENLEPAPPIAWIARPHRAAAGDRERAVPLLDEAAMTALSVGAASEAAAFWKEAADLSDDPVMADGFRLRAAEVSAAAAAAVVAG